MKDERTKIEKNKFFRKGLKNQQKATVFINHTEKKVAIFNAKTNKLISGWVMNQGQYDLYLKTGNII